MLRARGSVATECNQRQPPAPQTTTCPSSSQSHGSYGRKRKHQVPEAPGAVHCSCAVAAALSRKHAALRCLDQEGTRSSGASGAAAGRHHFSASPLRLWHRLLGSGRRRARSQTARSQVCSSVLFAGGIFAMNMLSSAATASAYIVCGTIWSVTIVAGDGPAWTETRVAAAAAVPRRSMQKQRSGGGVLDQGPHPRR